MEEIFVTKVRINKVRHLENLEIPLSDTERKHLILTGKNGSGKTSVLEGIVTFLNWTTNNYIDNEILENNIIFFHEYRKKQQEIEEELKYAKNLSSWKSGMIALERIKNEIREYETFITNNVPVELRYVSDFNRYFKILGRTDFIIKYFPSKRNFNPTESTGPQKIDLKDTYTINEDANTNFVKQLVNLRFDFLDSKDTGKNYEVEKIEKWFIKFETVLKAMFDDETLELVFDRPNFNYNIITKNHNPFNLNQLSDGFAAFLSIVTEIMMRMDKKFTSQNPYDLQGIVLIDEIETHLHIDLQKKILPFLTAFFPKIQFIVTTHSPFVLSSIDNAVIYDLEKQIRVEDLSGYSVDGIIEGYFDSEKYSGTIKKKIEEYEQLMEKDILNDTEKDRLYFLDKYLDELPDFLSPELQVKIQQIKLAKLV
ncbi:MAG: AAA family ATPase [Spirosomaceae bacterium]|jgi:predicted ATP-binding protein involved in virulence|nr:AAA family ATPase [Spirosomataceae bacterium]